MTHYSGVWIKVGHLVCMCLLSMAMYNADMALRRSEKSGHVVADW